MSRTRAKSPPRLTRDAERLIALALGLNASGSLTEDRYWEAQMSALVAKLLENGNDAPIDGALDHLYQTNLGAYDTLIELVENESESLVAMQADHAWQALLVAAPIVAWSKYAIPSGAIDRDEAQVLRVQLQAHVLAEGARVTLVPYLYSIDQLPRHFSELRRLAREARRLRDRPGAAEGWTSRGSRRPRTCSPTRASWSRAPWFHGAARSSAGRRTHRATPGAPAASSNGSPRRAPPSRSCCRDACSSACCPTPTT